jgi:abortive infection bacteriophage resistance protein
VSQGSTFFTRSFIKLKKPISFKEQVEKLKEKNIVVENHAECQEFFKACKLLSIFGILFTVQGA